ncbi:hypothetical protein AB6A40_006794 [Gnathostoma spinigerum]|uniref:Uncharacterized protein n=1 Tax=Gnathostoma spinigerum TaxID=75299 RepID=A0ABD6EV13_9BILA
MNQLQASYNLGMSQAPATSTNYPGMYQAHFSPQLMIPPTMATNPIQPSNIRPSGGHLPSVSTPYSVQGTPIAPGFPNMASSTVSSTPQLGTQYTSFFPTAHPLLFPTAQQQITPQIAAAILQQLQQEQQQLGSIYNGLSSMLDQSRVCSNVFNTTKNDVIQQAGFPNCQLHDSSQPQTIPPPPPSSNPVLPSTRHSTVESHLPQRLEKAKNDNWQEETVWNEIEKRHSTSDSTAHSNSTIKTDGEPVWVMRDSYLKRLQREEDRSQELRNAQKNSEKGQNVADETIGETEQLLSKEDQAESESKPKKLNKKEVIVHEPAVLIEGVLFRARYLGSTQLICDGRPTKTSRMMQAQEAVARVKAPAGEIQPSTDIDLFISTEKIMVLNTDLQRISETDVRQDILMDHALRTISYIADIGDLVVLMARRMSQSASDDECSSDRMDGVRRTPRIICHVFESDEASFIAQSIGQAFQVAYVEFLRANGIDDPSYLREIDYQEVLNSQELMGEELEMFAKKETQKDIVVPKKAGESLGVVVVESGWGSMLPTVVIANLQPGGAAQRCNQLNIGDQIIAINGISLVGLPLSTAQQNIKAAKTSTAVKLTVVSTPPVVEVRIKRPDTKYQLGFSVQNGVICSLLRGGIAERGGIRVGHRIIEINGQSVVAVAHEKIVNMLATAIGEIHMKTMPTSVFRLLTGQEVPNYI